MGNKLVFCNVQNTPPEQKKCFRHVCGMTFCSARTKKSFRHARGPVFLGGGTGKFRRQKKKKSCHKKKSSTRAYNLVCITPIYFELTETQAGNDKMDNSKSYIYMLYVRLQNRFHITSMVIAETTAE